MKAAVAHEQKLIRFKKSRGIMVCHAIFISVAELTSDDRRLSGRCNIRRKEAQVRVEEARREREGMQSITRPLANLNK